MKQPIRDILQIVVALLITGSTAYAMQPPAKNHVFRTISIVKHVVVAPKTAKYTPPIQTPVVALQNTSQPIVAPTTISSGCGDNSYANYIYEHESGCRLTAVNASSGDYGIGQSGGGLSSACPDWQTDYTCQNAFFTAYAVSRYGGWAAAYDHEVAYGWW